MAAKLLKLHNQKTLTHIHTQKQNRTITKTTTATTKEMYTQRSVHIDIIDDSQEVDNSDVC